MRQTVWPLARVAPGAMTCTRTVTAAHRGAAVLVGAAGLLQLLLLPQHWAARPLVGLVFAVLALGQLGLAAALWTSGGPRVRGLAGLTVGLPLGDRQGARGRFPRLLAAGVGLTFLLTDLVADGELLFSAEPFTPGWGLTVYATPPFGLLVPALQVSVAGHWALYLPWAGTALAVLVALGLALAVGWTVQLARLRPACPHRFGLLGASPALLAAPLCCGPSLLGVAGAGVLAAGSTLAQPLLLLAALLVTADAVWVRWQLRRAQTSKAAPCP